MRRGKEEVETHITCYYNNVRGLTSKIESLEDIFERVSPIIVALCETMKGKSTETNELFKEYDAVKRNVKKGKGGLVIAVKSGVFRKALDVTSTPNLNILVVRVEISDDRQFRIILCYSPQESATIEGREEFYTELSIEISRSISLGDYPMVVGDLNAKIKENEEGNVERLCHQMEYC